MIRLNEVSLYYPELPDHLAGVRIVQVSDLHCRGYGSGEKRLAEVLGEGCDLVVNTGDNCYQFGVSNPFRRSTGDLGPVVAGWSRRGFVLPCKSEETLAVYRRLIGEVAGEFGSFAVQGNHDPDEFMESLAELGVTVLSNESRQIEINGGVMNLCGVRGHGRKTADIAATVADIEPGLFTIAVTHYPEMAEGLAAGGVDLTLAGHTHGGQVCLPGGRPVITHSRTGTKYASGLARVGGGYVYTSRGMGVTVLAVRAFCPAEIVRLTLRRGEHSRNTLGRQWG